MPHEIQFVTRLTCCCFVADEGDEFHGHAARHRHSTDGETESREDALCCTEWSRGKDIRLVSSILLYLVGQGQICHTCEVVL